MPSAAFLPYKLRKLFGQATRGSYPCPHCRKLFKANQPHHVYLEDADSATQAGGRSGERVCHADAFHRQVASAVREVTRVENDQRAQTMQRAAREMEKVTELMSGRECLLNLLTAVTVRWRGMFGTIARQCAEIASLRRELQEAQDQIAKSDKTAQEAVQASEQILPELKKTQSELRSAKIEIDQLKRQVEEHRTELVDKNKEVRRLHNQLQELKNKERRQKDEINKLRQENEEHVQCLQTVASQHYALCADESQELEVSPAGSYSNDVDVINLSAGGLERMVIPSHGSGKRSRAPSPSPPPINRRRFAKEDGQAPYDAPVPDAPAGTQAATRRGAPLAVQFGSEWQLRAPKGQSKRSGPNSKSAPSTTTLPGLQIDAKGKPRSAVWTGRPTFMAVGNDCADCAMMILVLLGGSGRASPVVTLGDETVAIRHQMSTLKHNIRHQQAQLAALENTVLRGPRPLPPGIFNSPPMSPAELDATPPPPRIARRSSFEALQGLAGPDSSLPLPRKGSSLSFGEENGIREGIPTGSGSANRSSSPTRTLSHECSKGGMNREAVPRYWQQSPSMLTNPAGNARALAEEDLGDSSRSSANLHVSHSSAGGVSPRRASFAPGNTTKVLADLQAGVLNAKNALENTKAQLRVSQRQVSQLTRQTEDLKEVRERLRLENEGLNNVVARKERLLQEVLERARKAEAEVLTLRSQLKSETTTSKKTIRDMESSLVECTARTQKAEREYVVLRDTIKDLTKSFETDAFNLREEMKRREEKLKADAEEMGRKYKSLLEAVRKERESGGLGEVRWLLHENKRIAEQMEVALKEEMKDLRGEVDRHAQESDEAIQTAKTLATELSRLRRLMRQAGAAAAAEARNS
ncbi:hypothetical protein L227DRAFT_564427 [Lentinus tigrinus ALCF2SS1-6]|uniref:Uncharacterized protein n=1 Tax=Lentinus tigrinus ALCF2SS1-6 TaxID=1328759 RepID=A0A5C2S5E9_9APHY|nr:hypothetical protein L227DRAFT_564427 [Lentinus tigrinus ALCF2SS1-6]